MRPLDGALQLVRSARALPLLLLDALASVAAVRVSAGQMQCYSCMSLEYQSNWAALSQLYVMPASFTSRCDEPFSEQGQATVNCSSICVVFKEPQLQGGLFHGYMYIRGCLERLLRYGYNKTAVSSHRFFKYDICRSLQREQLFVRPAGETPLYGKVELCSCYGNRCNSALPRDAAAASAPLLLLVALLVGAVQRTF